MVRECLVAAGVLLVLGVLIFTSHVLHGSFYYDDWALSADERFLGFWSTVNFYLHVDHRPLVAIYYPLVQAVLGGDAHVQLAWIAFAHVAMCFCLYAFLRTAGLDRFGAGATTLLALLFPFADASWLYVIGSAGTVGVSLYLVGAIFALHGLRAHGTRAVTLHALALLFYIASVLTYELALLAVLLGALLYACRAPWRVALARWAIDVLTMLIVVIFITSRSVPILPGRDVHQILTLSQQLTHAKLIFQQGRDIVASSFEPFGPTHYNWVLAFIVVLLVAAWLVNRRLPAADPRRQEFRRSLLVFGLACCGVLAAWALLVPSDPYYSPGQVGVGNRINAFAGIWLCLAVYALARLVMTALLSVIANRPSWSVAGAAALLAAISLGYLHRDRTDIVTWNRAGSQQTQELATLRRALQRPSPATRILLFDSPAYKAPGVPVFAAPWDLDGAVKLLWEDATLSAYPVIAGTDVVCGHASIQPSGTGYAPEQIAPYGQAVFLDARTGTTARIFSPDQCRQTLRRFPPGPLVG